MHKHNHMYMQASAQDFLFPLLSLDRPRRPNVPSLSLSKLLISGSRRAASSRSKKSLRSSGKDDDDDTVEAVEEGRVYVRLGTVRPPPGPPLPWKKASHSSDAGLRVVHPERDLERDEDLLVVEDRAARDSILDTLDTQLPCLEGVPPSGLSSSSAAGTFIRVRWYCGRLKMGILIPLSDSCGLDPRDMTDLGIWGALDLASRDTLDVGVTGVLNRVVFTRCSYATSSSLSSLPLVPIHTPTPTGIKPLRLPVENVRNLLRPPLRQA